MTELPTPRSRHPLVSDIEQAHCRRGVDEVAVVIRFESNGESLAAYDRCDLGGAFLDAAPLECLVEDHRGWCERQLGQIAQRLPFTVSGPR
jgi:hypothetical protein